MRMQFHEGMYGAIPIYIDLLAKIVGSKKEAKRKIYMAWLRRPWGFAAEIDINSANKLKAFPDVLVVLPDYAFDLKDLDRGSKAFNMMHDFAFYCKCFVIFFWFTL